MLSDALRRYAISLGGPKFLIDCHVTGGWDSLAEANWSGFPLIAGDGLSQTLTDPATNSLQRFYRVRQQRLAPDRMA